MLDNDANAYEAYAEDNFDPRIEDLTPISLETGGNRRIAVLRTSDRNAFRRCRRSWNWSSHLRNNLTGITKASPLWLGSGFHFALEDFHSTNAFIKPSRAFQAYVVATSRAGGIHSLPDSWREDMELAKGLLDYYSDRWLSTRDPLQTFIYNDIPQVEVSARVELPITEEVMAAGYDGAVYSITLDRVTIDDDEILWINEYKTAKAIRLHHFETDSQVSSYCWAASLLYPNHQIGGVIYQQHRKTLPEPATFLQSGKLSTNKSQSTDYHYYREAIENMYLSVDKAPAEIKQTLNHFAQLEEISQNKWIRRDKIFRNTSQMAAEGEKILLEMSDMLNAELPLYPNPADHCKWCTFKGACIGMDAGEDWEQELALFTHPKEAKYDSWRAYLPTPEELT